MTFTAPAGASIADFRIERSLFFYNPTVPEAPRSPYILFLARRHADREPNGRRTACSAGRKDRNRRRPAPGG